MNCGHEHRHRNEWDATGSAAEEFARRIARDAQRFGERVAKHATDFARDVAREWRHGPTFDTRPFADDIRDALKEVRTLVAEVIEGVDDLLGRVLQPEPAATTDTWARVVTNRDVACVACHRTIGAGEECHLRRMPGAREFRCTECGPPDGDTRGAETPKSEPPPRA